MIGPGLYWALGLVLFIVLFGMFMKWLVENFLTEREASIASFSLMLGNSIGSLLYLSELDYIAVTEKVGSILGLVVLWWLLFKRKAAHG